MPCERVSGHFQVEKERERQRQRAGEWEGERMRKGDEDSQGSSTFPLMSTLPMRSNK